VWVVAITVLCVRMDVEKEQVLLNLGFWQETFFLQIRTQAVALKGCYAFAGALLVVQLVSHACIGRALLASDRRRVDRGTSLVAAEHPLFAAPPLKSLMQREGTGGFWHVLVTVGCFAAFFGLALGCVLPALHVEYHFGTRVKKWIMDESIEIREVVETYSVVRGAAAMAATGTHHAGGENLGAMLLTFTLAVAAPLLRSFLAMMLWFVPTRGGAQKGLAKAMGWLGAVSQAEVFAAAVLLMAWQLPGIFEHMDESAKYVALSARPYSGLYVFGAAALVDALVGPAVHRRYHATVAAERAAGGGVAMVQVVSTARAEDVREVKDDEP